VALVLSQSADPNRPLDEDPHWRSLEAIIVEGVFGEAPSDISKSRLLSSFWYDDRKFDRVNSIMFYVTWIAGFMVFFFRTPK
jgi:hypothetical protein